MISVGISQPASREPASQPTDQPPSQPTRRPACQPTGRATWIDLGRRGLGNFCHLGGANGAYGRLVEILGGDLGQPGVTQEDAGLQTWPTQVAPTELVGTTWQLGTQPNEQRAIPAAKQPAKLISQPIQPTSQLTNQPTSQTTTQQPAKLLGTIWSDVG